MNQINLDSLLHIGSTVNQTATTSPLAPLKLSPDTLYQGLLNIGRDGSAQLQMSTPQGQVQIKLSPDQTALLLAGQGTARVSQGQANPAIPNSQQYAQQNNPLVSQVKLNLAIQQLPSGQLQLDIQAPAAPTAAVSLTATQLLNLLGPGKDVRQLQFEVQLRRTGDQLILQLPNQRQLQLPLSFLPESNNWPEQQPQQALLKLDVKQDQLQIKLQLMTVCA